MLSLFHKLMQYEEYLLIAFFFIIEQIANKFSFLWNNRGRLLNNIFLKALQAAIYILAGKVFAMFIIQINIRHIGLFYLINLPEFFRIIIGVAAIDFSAYWVHRLCHGPGFFWKIHLVHHSDLQMDTTTNWRGHPLEGLFFVASRIVIAAFLGIDFPTVTVYVMILVPVSVLSHVNLKFPKWIDQSFGLILVTPNFHKVHHDNEMAYTNSNYGECFIIWDRLFNTFKQKNIKEINYGLIEYNSKKSQRIINLLINPFLPSSQNTMVQK